MLLIGVPYDLNNKAGVYPSLAVSMPARRVQLTIQSIFASDPSAIDLDLEGSNDGVTFNPIADANLLTESGEILTVNTSAKFIRLNGTVTGGTGIQILVVAKA